MKNTQNSFANNSFEKITELLVSSVGLELTNGMETPDNMLDEKQKQVKHLVNEAGFKVVALLFPGYLKELSITQVKRVWVRFLSSVGSPSKPGPGFRPG
jgi:hypothetical protein